ncbi:MAG TPA: FliM/FliN family flagellar motor switch protein [Polyangiaceae bacterium]|jgi:flagellar motor switch/type III secretory pathway protein FliN
MSAAPFPWKSLDSIRRADVAMLAKMRRAVTRFVDTAGASNALRELLGNAELSVRLRRVTSSPPRIDESSLGILLAPGERADRRRAFVVVLEQALAGAIVARALKRPPVRVVDPSRQQPSLAGAAAAVLVAAARRDAGAALRVLTAGPAHTVLGEVVSIDPVPIGATFTVVVEDDAYLAHVFAPRSALEPARESDLDAAALASLGAMPIEVPLVAAVLETSVADFAALAPGDALFPLTIARTPAGFGGELLLSAPDSDAGFAVDLGDGGRLVLREGPLPLFAEKTPMVDKDVLAQSIGETPVVVRVEVGSAQMTAREWAALGAGDVVALGKRIGENVILRVGGAEVARGELVDVEGEIGVRIVARAGGTVA